MFKKLFRIYYNRAGEWYISCVSSDGGGGLNDTTVAERE